MLVDNKASDHRCALERTETLISEACPAIFEAAFGHNNRRVRVDILKRLGEGRWALYEVKASTFVRDEHYQDAVFQADVLRQSGIDLEGIFIAHVDSSYLLGSDGLDVSKFFKFVDVTAELRDQSIGQSLHALGPPAFYLDFEAMIPGIPMYVGTGRISTSHSFSPYIALMTESYPTLITLHRPAQIHGVSLPKR